MALARNTGSTLGGICVNLLINDGGVVVDLGSAASTPVAHANVTYGSASWDGNTRPYFQTAEAISQGVTFSANAPVLKHGSGEGGNGQFLAMAKGVGTAADKQHVVTTSANFAAGFGYGADSGAWVMVGANGTLLLTSGQADATTDYTTETAIVWNSKFNQPTDGRQIFVDADTGTQSTWDAEATEGGDGPTGATVASIGFSTAATTYLGSRIFVYANFSRLLTLSEAQQLRDDWWTQLITEEAAAADHVKARRMLTWQYDR